jgi:hypothetical protein
MSLVVKAFEHYAGHKGTKRKSRSWIIFMLATARQYVIRMTGSQQVTESSRQNAAFPLEYRFDLESLMRAILPISCSLLRSWTVLPSGL